MVRLRADLVVQPTKLHGRQYWLLRDPLRRHVLRVTDRDYQRLHSDDLSEASDPDLVQLAAQQHLLIGVRNGEQVAPRGSRFNPLYIRLPGVDADALLQALVRRTQWLFSAQAIIFWSLVVAVAIGTVLVYARDFAAALPSFQKFFAAENWLALTLTMVLTKIVHELAHGIVCRRMGVRCPEIGFLLMCGTPCMYCDVTESSMLPSRWQRASVMLAGIYVEAIMAAVATFIWWASDPGPVYYASMNVMFVCGASTVVFNLNPLMRFDGYYVLSDLLDIPNLRQQAAAAWRLLVVSRIAGAGYGGHALRKPRRSIVLAAYHALATMWRLFATTAIAFWIVALCDSVHLVHLGYALAGAIVIATGLPYVRALLAIMRGDGSWKGVVRMRRATILAVAGCGLVVAMCFPLPHRIAANGKVDFAEASRVYVLTEGAVERVMVDFGSRVTVDQPLLNMSNQDLLKQQIQLTSQVAEASLSVAVLRQRALSAPEMMQQWNTQNAAWKASVGRQANVETQLAELKISSPTAGIVLPPSQRSMDVVDHMGELAGRYLPVGTEVCRIGDPDRLQVILEIDAQKRQYIDIGTRVRIFSRQRAATWINCEVVAISQIQSSDDAMPAIVAEQQRFRVLCQLPRGSALLAGSDATAMLLADPKCLYKRIASKWAW